MLTDEEREAVVANARRDAWVNVLVMAASALGWEFTGNDALRLQVERASAVMVLRRLCVEHGANPDWDDSLSLAEIIEAVLQEQTREPTEDA